MTEPGPPQPIPRTGVGRERWRRAAEVAGRVFRDKTPRDGWLIFDVSVPDGGAHPGRVDRAANDRVEWPRAAPPGECHRPPGGPPRPKSAGTPLPYAALPIPEHR